VEDALRFIREQFMIRNRNPYKLVYSYYSVATDTENTACLFRTLRDTLVLVGLSTLSLF
jgi:hypothetical protein